MSVQRSNEVMSVIANIDANKAAAADQLLKEWQANLDPNVYDVYEELGEAAASAPAWQLYGAALTGDFGKAASILRGRQGAGATINSISAPQAKIARGFGRATANLVGDTNNSLVFTPIAPCRVVDTRGAGARTGLIPANGLRSFDLTTSAFTSGQGGAAACPGLPSFSHLGWSVNITVTNGYVANGGLKAWGFSAAEPNASVINFTPASSGGIANGLTLTGCFGCGDDVTIRSFGDGTHVIIDVMGYYEEAVGTQLAVTRLAGTATPLVLGTVTISGADCPGGTTLVGGEMDDTQTTTSLADFFAAGSHWVAEVRNTSASGTATVYVEVRGRTSGAVGDIDDYRNRGGPSGSPLSFWARHPRPAPPAKC